MSSSEWDSDGEASTSAGSDCGQSTASADDGPASDTDTTAYDDTLEGRDPSCLWEDDVRFDPVGGVTSPD
eukprot:11063066-Lingulodinium_polyedra.AAC.1